LQGALQGATQGHAGIRATLSPMSSSEWAAAALQSFDAVVQATEGFRSRAGQRRMAEEVARVFSVATLGKGPGAESAAAPDQVAANDSAAAESAAESGANPGRAIAVIQAGTGVGKSLAYGAPAVALALDKLGGRSLQEVREVATIDVKADEPGLLAFCASNDLPLRIIATATIAARAWVTKPSEWVDGKTIGCRRRVRTVCADCQSARRAGIAEDGIRWRDGGGGRRSRRTGMNHIMNMKEQ